MHLYMINLIVWTFDSCRDRLIGTEGRSTIDTERERILSRHASTPRLYKYSSLLVWWNYHQQQAPQQAASTTSNQLPFITNGL